ncbi:MAG TPA: thermonuclease family protein [Allocoleopsis sp.]
MCNYTQFPDVPSSRFRRFLKSSRWLSIAILIPTLVGCKALENLLGGSGYTVKRVSDGDTLTVADSSGKDLTVRFACVDAPEVPHSAQEKRSRKATDKNQFKWGNQAKQRLQQLVQQGRDRVTLTITDSDRYGRKISEVRLPDGTFIQQVLAQEGLVQVYKPYLKNCPSAKIVQTAEADAKQRRVGVWGDKQYISAWEWRHTHK